MKDKYYSPKIEEFHVGFEYYKNGILLNQKGEETDAMQHCIFSETDNLKEINRTSTSVKYLDKEDIESLRWVTRDDQTKELKELYSDNRFFIKRNMRDDGQKFYLFILDLSQNVVSIYYKKYGAIRGYGDSLGQIIFRGTIKNKSELQKLMKQLGI